MLVAHLTMVVSTAWQSSCANSLRISSTTPGLPCDSRVRSFRLHPEEGPRMQVDEEVNAETSRGRRKAESGCCCGPCCSRSSRLPDPQHHKLRCRANGHGCSQTPRRTPYGRRVRQRHPGHKARRYPLLPDKPRSRYPEARTSAHLRASL